MKKNKLKDRRYNKNKLFVFVESIDLEKLVEMSKLDFQKEF